MTDAERFVSERFPRSSAYHPAWIAGGVSGGANQLWLAEWLAESLDLRPGMRLLDLGCGRAVSSIFFCREFGVQVWATDLWFSASENLRRVRDAGLEHGVFPIHADARSLPFAAEFFDAIVCIDSFYYSAAAHPAIGEMEQALLDAGALGVRMSGSGPTVFGIFDTENGCRDSAKKLQMKGWRLYPAETLAGPLYGEHLAPAS